MFEKLGTHIYDFQSLLVGIVGFGGVMLTLAYNARLARQQEDLRLANERSAVRGALAAEMIANVTLLKLNKVRLAKNEGRNSIILNADIQANVYRAMLDRIPRLEHEEVVSCITAYMILVGFPITIKRELKSRNMPETTDERYIDVPRDLFDALEQLNNTVLTTLEKNIEFLLNPPKSQSYLTAFRRSK